MKREFTRKEYEKVKKMDRREMQDYIEGKYKEGYEEGSKGTAEPKEIKILLDGLEAGEWKGIGKSLVGKIIGFAKSKGVYE